MYTFFVSVFLCFISCYSLSAQWTQCNGPFGNSARTFTTTNTSAFVGAESGLYRSTDYGNTWKRIDSLLTKDYMHLTYKSNTIIAQGNTILAFSRTNFEADRSSDNGDTWQSIPTLPSSISIRNLTFIGDAVYLTSSRAWELYEFYVHSIYHSSDNGKTWRQESSEIGEKIENEKIAATYYQLYRSRQWDVFSKSSNRGVDWQEINTGLKNNYIQSMASLGNTIYIVSNAEVHRSNTEGETWEKVAIPATNCTDIQIVGGSIFVLTQNSDIFLSRDNCSTWLKIPQLNQLINTQLRIIDNIIFAGTYDQGLWKLDLNSLTSVEEQTNAHNNFDLMLSPNPNNGMLHCTLNSYQDNAPSSLEIYSMQGEKVLQQIIEQPSMTLDISHIPTGIYYVIAHSGNQSTRQVLSLVK